MPGTPGHTWPDLCISAYKYNSCADPSCLQHSTSTFYRQVSSQNGCLQYLGTGKPYLIQCLKLLLKENVRVAAPTGVAAFNVDGYTLHSILGLPVKGEFKELEGNRLQNIQESLAGVEYIIIDEMSMIGRKLFGQVDRRLRQAFPHR